MTGTAAKSDLDAAHRLIPGIQGLRALAALSVAFVHIASDSINNGGDPAGLMKAVAHFMPWEAGVDIFFVISGFVIVHASAPLFGQHGGSQTFLRRRLTRIVPLYWIMTTAFLAVLLFSRAAIHGDIGGPVFLVASYLFIPWPRPDGLVQPAFGLGWTLNYEMFFYAVFTPFLLLQRQQAVAGAGILFCAMVAYGQIIGFANLQLAVWSNPIILEFVAGMLIALCRAHNIRLPMSARILLFAFGIIGFHFAIFAPIAWRVVAYGLPAASLVGAVALAAPAASLTPVHRLLVRLGDASYAMYLVHPFVMRGFTALWHKIHSESELAGLMYVAAGLLAAQGCALAINVVLERRLNILLRRKPIGLLNEAV